MPVPTKINSHFTPIGKIYDIGIEGVENPDFGGEYAELIFSYDNVNLGSKGFIKEFMVFYFDENDGIWKQVDRIEQPRLIIRSKGHAHVEMGIPQRYDPSTDPPRGKCIGWVDKGG